MFLLVVLFLCVKCLVSSRLWCPPKNFLHAANKTVKAPHVAIIGEIHGELFLVENEINEMSSFVSGDELAHFIYHNIGALGVEKLYLSVMYNTTLHPNGPTVEDIYPSSKYCVVDWFDLGVIGWKLTPYGGPIDTWPKNDTGHHTLSRDAYKTRFGYNHIYERK